MTQARFHVGQRVRLSLAAQMLFREFGERRPTEGTVFEIRDVDGRRLYHVGGQMSDDPNDLWSMDFREEELAEAGRHDNSHDATRLKYISSRRPCS